MAKASIFLCGILLGLLAGMAGVRAFDRFHDPRLDDPAGRASESADRSTGEEERKKVETALEESRRANGELQAEIAALKTAKEDPAAADGARAAAARKANPWNDVGARFWELRDKLRTGGERSSPEVEAAFMEMLGILGKIAKENGVTLDEAMLSPDGLAALMLSILDAAGQGARGAELERALDDARAGWKEFLARREGLSRLEARRDLMLLDGKTATAVRGALSPEQEAVLKELDLFDANIGFGTTHHVGGSRERIAETLASDWGGALRLDDGQKASLGPVVDEYMNGVLALQEDWARREMAGQRLTGQQRQIEQLDLMVKAQKRIGETMRLTEEQAKALKDWPTSYDFQIQE